MSSYPFGLSGNPFAAGHDTRFIFSYDKRLEAVTLLRRRIAEGASLVTVTGDSGCGKTSVVTEVLEAADLKARAAFIAHPSLTPSELLEAVCIEFGAPLPSAPSKPQTLASLEHHLRDLSRQGCVAVLVLDEAHGLKTELLEEARLLSNMKHDGRGLLQTVLVGLPELERHLGLPELAQLRQRIAVHCRMTPLTPEETTGYVQHRVGAAGGDGPALFPAATCEEIHAYTNGLPRDINTLAGRALEHAEEEGALAVTPDHVRMAAGDARPGITTVQRASVGPQSFELKRKASPPRAAVEAPRAPERPVEREPAPKPEIRTPPSFLRAQHAARSGGPIAVPEGVPPPPPTPTLEQRFRSGEVSADELATEPAGGSTSAPDQSTLASEHIQELSASVLLVGVLVVALIVTGRWNPVPPAPAPAPPQPQLRSVVATDPTMTSRTAGAAPARAESSQAAAPAATGTTLPPDVPVAERWVEGARQGYGFEVAASSVPDSAIAVLRRIMRTTKLPCRIVTKTTGDTYRVVVGPFASRREAQKAINDLFKTPVVRRAQLVQIPE